MHPALSLRMHTARLPTRACTPGKPGTPRAVKNSPTLARARGCWRTRRSAHAFIGGDVVGTARLHAALLPSHLRALPDKPDDTPHAGAWGRYAVNAPSHGRYRARDAADRQPVPLLRGRRSRKVRPPSLARRDDVLSNVLHVWH